MSSKIGNTIPMLNFAILTNSSVPATITPVSSIKSTAMNAVKWNNMIGIVFCPIMISVSAKKCFCTKKEDTCSIIQLPKKAVMQ